MAPDGSNVSGNWQRYPEQKHVPTSRPTIPYAQMIVQAIESSPGQKTTLKEIYEYISENYPFFRTTKNGWKNSIRHNLSLNKNFVRVPRPSNEKGKGAYWAIDPDQVGMKKSIKKYYKKKCTPHKMHVQDLPMTNSVSIAAEHYLNDHNSFQEHYRSIPALPTKNQNYSFQWQNLSNISPWPINGDYSQLEQLLDLDQSMQTSQASVEFYIENNQVIELNHPITQNSRESEITNLEFSNETVHQYLNEQPKWFHQQHQKLEAAHFDANGFEPSVESWMSTQ